MQNPLELLNFSGRRTLPIIQQTEMAECGLACLAMIASYHGHDIDLNTIRRHYPISLRGTTLQTLMQTADKMDFACRPLRLELDELDQLKTPTILHWDMNHFVVLKSVSKKYIVIHDPAQGMRKLSFAEVSKHFTGVALELTPTPKFQPKDEVRKIPLSMFWQRMVGLKGALVQVFLLSVALQIFSLISPQYMQFVVDDVLHSFDVHFLKVLALGFLLLMLIEVGTTALRSLLVMSFSSMLNIQMAANLFRHLIRLPLPYFEKRHIGDIVSRFGSLGQIEKLLTTGIVQAIVDGMMAIATLIMLFIYSPFLASLVIVALLGYSVIRFLWYRPLKALTEETIIAAAKENTNFMETIRATQSIKIFGKETQRQVLWQNRNAEKINSGIRMNKLKIAFTVINTLLFGIENILVVYFGAKLVMANAFTVGMLYAYMSYKQQFIGKAVALIENFIELKMLGLHLERLGDIILEEPEVQEGGMLVAPELQGGIRLENISFRYSENEPYILKNINLTIKPGESVAIVGPSGCGKTTLMKVMMGLFTPEEGKVFIDDIELDKLGMKNFREQIGAVMQNDQLLSGSISENISFFDPQFDQLQIEKCAQLAVIAHDIAAMPMGYNTLIGDMGMTLSGGQKQRVVLARALYKQPKILFMDEATSHLDVALEQAVNQAIKHLNTTRIIIAHRPETIRSADRIFVFTPQGLIEQPKVVA
ncbi:MAG: ABC transporter ATP-binding protein [Gammaproteobacteria bacterium 39-13]|nr:peptidase domain-containing ABC transporter [Gammaproteobacteria bacterium]OJV89008.1 MAG: ABC transporter ATP-binding protein [Gammaproteobacteria bacterium 39-13]